MISMWAYLTEGDVEGYAATIVLPSYLAHLELQPFSFDGQPENSDGQELLRLTYSGEGRIEEFALDPEDHALAAIRFVCPGIDDSRIQLPRDDASWHWSGSDEPQRKMRVYFSPTTEALHGSTAPPPSEQAYVSVSRGHAFLGRPVVESYLRAWLGRLGIEGQEICCDFDTPSAGIEFTAGPVGGQMFLDEKAVAEDLMRFAGLDKALDHVSDLVEIDLDSDVPDDSGVCKDGIYISLSQRTEGPGESSQLSAD